MQHLSKFLNQLVGLPGCLSHGLRNEVEEKLSLSFIILYFLYTVQPLLTGGCSCYTLLYHDSCFSSE